MTRVGGDQRQFTQKPTPRVCEKQSPSPARPARPSDTHTFPPLAQTSPTLKTEAEISAKARPGGPGKQFPPEEQPWGSQAWAPRAWREAAAGSWKPELPRLLEHPGGPRGEPGSPPLRTRGPGIPCQLQPLLIHSPLGQVPGSPTKARPPAWLPSCRV